MSTRARRDIFTILAWVLLVLHAPGVDAAVSGGSDAGFDHLATGFPLTGAHLAARCEGCHLNGVMRGTPRDCDSCHGSGARITTATRVSANHIPFKQSCDQCHQTTVWTIARINHSTLDSGSCVRCHNGVTAVGKSVSHITTSSECHQCHRTTAWTPATFSHSGVAPGTCANCHNGTIASGKSASHFVTTRSCDACHRTTAWTPITAYSHISPGYRAHRSGMTCTACHKTNNEVIAWQFPAYRPDCAGCHASDFRQNKHKKTESPSTIFYTVSELRDCSGSCHLYNDSTFTTIKKARNGEHHATDGSFD